MNTLIIIGIVYIVGFFLSLLFLAKFGKYFELDHYDEEKTYANYDDYDSNASAYFSFSIAWPLFYLFGIFGLLYNWFIEIYKKLLK